MSTSRRPRILMSFCTDWYWLDVAESLVKLGIQIDFLISRPPEVQAAAKKRLRGTTVLNQDTLEYPHLIRAANRENPVVLSAPILNQLKECEIEFLQITDRLAFFPLSVARRREIFKELVRYWYWFFQDHKLDAIFLTDAPHVGFDTVMYSVAKTFFSLPIISIRRPFIRDRMILVNEYNAFLPKVPKRFQLTSTKKQLETLVGKELIEDVFTVNAWQKKDKQISEHIHTRTQLNLRALFRLLQILNPLNWYAYITSLFTLSKYGGFNYNDGQIKMVEKICGVYHRYHLQQQRDYYDTLTSTFSWHQKSKFIYFPLHLQPERSTIPEGGVFEDQMMALDILRACLPSGWKILVKEHPRQFHKFDFQKHMYRSKAYYKRIHEMKNVTLCPMHIPQEELVKRAELTATITGTGGWESLCIGKPAFVFGNTWYGGCQSCFYIDSVTAAKESLAEARKKKFSEVELDVLRFLAYYRDRLLVASNAREFALQSDRPYQKLVDNMAIAVQKEISNAL